MQHAVWQWQVRRVMRSAICKGVGELLLNAAAAHARRLAAWSSTVFASPAGQCHHHSLGNGIPNCAVLTTHNGRPFRIATVCVTIFVKQLVAMGRQRIKWTACGLVTVCASEFPRTHADTRAKATVVVHTRHCTGQATLVAEARLLLVDIE